MINKKNLEDVLRLLNFYKKGNIGVQGVQTR